MFNKHKTITGLAPAAAAAADDLQTLSYYLITLLPAACHLPQLTA